MNNYFGRSVGEYLIHFRNGLKLFIDAIQEDKIVRSRDNVFVIMKYVVVDPKVVNQIMCMSDKRIDKIYMQHQLSDKDTNHMELVDSTIGKCEMTSFMIENDCKELSRYRIVIKVNAKFVDMYGGR